MISGPGVWSLSSIALVVRPFGGGERCSYTILRDHLQQSYHEIAFAAATYP
jgi:hypothetical protein